MHQWKRKVHMWQKFGNWAFQREMHFCIEKQNRKEKSRASREKRNCAYDLVTIWYLSLLLSALISWSHSCNVNRAVEDKLFLFLVTSRFSKKGKEKKKENAIPIKSIHEFFCWFVWVFTILSKRSSCVSPALIRYGDTKFRAVIFMDCSFLLCIKIPFFKKKHLNVGALAFLMSGRQRILSCCWHFHIQSSNLQEDGSFVKFSFIKADSCQLLTHSTHEKLCPSPLVLYQGLPQFLAALGPFLPQSRQMRGSWQSTLSNS